MLRAAPPFTPGFMPYRPRETGWVAYHDVASLPGRQGIAMTWRVPDKGLRWVAVVNRAKDGYVHSAGWLGETQDLSEVINDAERGDRNSRIVTEGEALGLLFPHKNNRSDKIASGGLPPLDEHAALARQAVEAADISPAMRRAFTACLDHGAPHNFPLARLRQKTFSPEWPGLEMATRHRVLARAINQAGPMLLTGDDPMGKIRKKWPRMTEAHLRRLEEEDCAKALLSDSTSNYRAVTKLPLLLSIPLDWWPRKQDWRPFEACAATIGAISRSPFGAISHETLASSCGGDWAGFARRLTRAAGLDEEDYKTLDLAERGADYGDPVRMLARDLTVPLFAFMEDDDGRMRMEYAYGQDLPQDTPVERRDPGIVAAQRAAQSILYQGKSAPGILELSARWHGRQEKMQADIRGKDGGAVWPPLFEGEYRDGNVGVVAISDYGALREEGAFGPDRHGVRGLDHCVASRLPDCLTGQAHVLSVRLHAEDGSWRRLSTCQVSVEGMGERCGLSVTEHRARGNADPCVEAKAAVSGLAKAVREGRVGLQPEALERRSPSHGGSIAKKCGYDWRDESELTRAIRTWEPLLPRWARGLGPSGLYDALTEMGYAPAREATGAAPRM